ncbi:hypothetical protein HGH93_08650 [Chitinophaga polysaccharea]|uniref:hypothetical protein n=1 Tax=Chitinophaga polysaccharea TaxID=1293035 RepID=UPI001455270E|nr:hypothetical protein [Chitinophaga polysaccharea]NLR58164.1 hypothetical protein [Chitinophaga polysaccharea]
MEIKAIQKYQEFLSKAQLIDQTSLIDDILKQDRQLHYFNNVINRVEYKLSLSDGKFIGSDDLLADKRIKVTARIGNITSRLKEQLLEKEHRELLLQKNTLEADLSQLEDAKGEEKPIFYWYLVPHWLSGYLLEMGETVFRHWGCNWWGVSSLLQEYWSKDRLLLDIMEEVSIENNL